MGGAGRGRKKAGRCQNRERDPHCAGKATCVSYCLMNKICRTNRVGLCAARRRHTAAKIAQSQTVEFEEGIWGEQTRERRQVRPKLERMRGSLEENTRNAREEEEEEAEEEDAETKTQ